jgi:HPP family protein
VIVTCLPDGRVAESDWELRYTAKGYCNADHKGKLKEMCANPFRYWTTVWRRELRGRSDLLGIGFEVFGHTAICPWAKRPLFLPAACFLTASGGLLFWNLLGAGPAAAACSMACGIAVLRLFDLHVPPALAVALLPFVMDSPTIAYPFSVGIGTLLMTLWFLFYQSFFGRLERSQ